MIHITPAPPTHTAELAFFHYNTLPRKSQCGIRCTALPPRIPVHPPFLIRKLTVSQDAKAAAVLKGHTSCGNPLFLHVCRRSAQRKSRLYTVMRSCFAIDAVPRSHKRGNERFTHACSHTVHRQSRHIRQAKASLRVPPSDTLLFAMRPRAHSFEAR